MTPIQNSFVQALSVLSSADSSFLREFGILANSPDAHEVDVIRLLVFGAESMPNMFLLMSIICMTCIKGTAVPPPTATEVPMVLATAVAIVVDIASTTCDTEGLLMGGG